jgi:hypothetical protein
MSSKPRKRCVLTLALCGVLALASTRLSADPPQQQEGKKPASDLPSGLVTAAMWKEAATTPLQPGEIDRLVSQELQRVKAKPSPRTTDEQFLRRVYLDLTGALPVPADINDFLKDTDPQKRAKVIDRLLASDAYARHWGRYWREVIESRVTDGLLRLTAREFERWMVEQLKANKSWGETARLMLTAEGEMRFDGSDKNGAAYLLSSRRGADAVTERAAEVSRILMGIQIQCAQCHDHPFDSWKREQFHQFAAYFGRLRDRILFEEKKIVGVKLISSPFGEYQMPGQDNPKKKTAVQPRFLDGKAPAARLNDPQRRKALADVVTSKDNPWFAAAFVNRMWGELMGQSFYQPIDDMGPQKEAVFPTVLARVAGSFRGSDYDIKALLRAVLNSETYQRQIRPGEAPDDHLLFASVYPSRLRADALWQSLVGALGPMAGGPGGFKGKGPPGGFGRFGLEGQFKQEFGFDPSTKAEEVEGSISQALIMMNSPLINQKIKATGTNVLARILASNPKDDEAIRMVYQRTLARAPSERELTRCREHIRTVGNRAEAFEDILWALLNSTEFQTKR